MKRPIPMYIIISIICVIAIIIGVYVQFKAKTEQKTQETIQETEVSQQEKERTINDVKNDFNSLFNNEYIEYDTDLSLIEKRKKAEKIVFTAFSKEEETELYNININIPIINIKGDIPTKLNQKTQDIFVKKANEIIKNKDINKKAIYNVDYAAFLNGNILSVVIKASLKQGNNPQRIIVQTYNYDIAANKTVTLNEILEEKNINDETVNNRITEVIEQAIKNEEIYSLSGYQVYNRSLNNSIYVIENINVFFMGKDSKLYLVFPYGNVSYTSEIDIVEL